MPRVGSWSPEEDGFTYTLLQNWLQCRQLAWYRLAGFKPKVPSLALQYGGVVSMVLEKGYNFLAALAEQGKSKVPSREKVQDWILQVEEEYRKRYGGELGNKGLDQLELVLAFAEATLPAYFEFWKRDLSNLEIVSPEGNFIFSMTIPNGKKVRWKGRWDLVFRRKGKLWVLETKTSSRFEDEVIASTLPMDLQTNIYCLGVYARYGQWPAGVVRNMIRRPGLREKKGETFSAYAKRCIEDVQSRPEHYFARFELATEQSEMEAFKETLRVMSQEMWSWYYDAGYPSHYRNPAGCNAKFRCEFLSLCSGEDPAAFIRSKDRTPYALCPHQDFIATCVRCRVQQPGGQNEAGIPSSPLLQLGAGGRAGSSRGGSRSGA